MRKLFTEDNKIFQFLSLMADLMILTVQWLVACIPVVTVGAATTALYSCVMKRYKEEIRLFRDFLFALLHIVSDGFAYTKPE